MASESVDILENDEDLEILLTAIEADFKAVSAALESTIKGLKALGKRVKKEGREDILVAKGSKRLTDVLDLAVGTAKSSGASYGSTVLKELHH